MTPDLQQRHMTPDLQQRHMTPGRSLLICNTHMSPDLQTHMSPETYGVATVSMID